MRESPALGREANTAPRNDNAHKDESGGRSDQESLKSEACGGPPFNLETSVDRFR